MNNDRRRLLKGALGLIGAGVTMTAVPVRSAPLQVLKETDPEAVNIGYYASARKVDRSKYPNYQDGQTCANCSLIGFSPARRRPCTLVPEKLVDAGGWCKLWVEKV